jgi:hypothetical protein
VAAYNKPFSNGLEYPGEVNCRCYLLYFLDKDHLKRGAKKPLDGNSEVVASGTEKKIPESPKTAEPRHPRVSNKLNDYDEFGPKMRGALKYYTGEGFRDINHPLRHGLELSEKAEDAMDRLDGLLEEEWLTKGVVYRGYNSEKFLLDNDEDLIGSRFTDPAFVSTSHNKANAQVFINAAKHPVMAEIHIPDGAHGFDIPSKFTEYDVGESEVLLPRDSEFEVTSREIRDGTTWVKLRLVT